MKCLNCGKKLNLVDEICPYCGEQVFDDDEPITKNQKFTSKKRTKKQPIFTEEEAFLMHIHPNDELYRKCMELNILSKDYK